MDLLKNSSNPQAMMSTLMNQNPQLKSVMELVNRYGGDPRTAFFSLAKERGIDPNEVLNLLK